MSHLKSSSYYEESFTKAKPTLSRILLILTYAFIFVLPWRASMVIFGERTIGVVIGLTMVFIFGISKLFHNTLRSPGPFHVAFILLVVWTILTSLWSIDVQRTLSASIRPVLVLGFIIILWDLFDSYEQVVASLKAYIAGCYVLAAMAFYEFLYGEPSMTTYGSARYVGMGAQAPNIQSVMIVLGMCAAWFVFRKTNSPRIKIACLGYIPVSLFTVFIAGSRHGFVLITVGFVYIMTSIIINRSNLLTIPVIGIGGAITYLYSPGVARIATIPEEVMYGDLNRRLELWQEAFIVGVENVFTGIGFRTFFHIGDASPHNSFLSVFVGTGIIGLLLYTYIHYRVFYYSLNLKQDKRLFGVFTLLVLLLSHAALSNPYNPIIWYFMSIILLLSDANYSVSG